MNSILDNVRTYTSAVPTSTFGELRRTFPATRFRKLLGEGFHFYHTTFWYPLDRAPENVFESVAASLRGLAAPGADVVGVEWWFSVQMTNKTPQWLLSCHFDRDDIDEKDVAKLRFPDKGSVLFLNPVPYGELVVTDQVLTERGARPKQPTEMRFVKPARNLYAVFPGHLHHGVIGRMWRPLRADCLRVAMAINWWTQRPKAPYLRNSTECMQAFGLTPSRRRTVAPASLEP